MRESDHKMFQREEEFSTKQEISTSSKNSAKILKASPTYDWSRLKDPRIVRVSRAFGGKDRHSKVCTVRGLRDRRVRLSVPTAIQLYDLQERLGLNQPSKVVDWLLNAAKNEIDELPPLQFPQGSFISQNHHHPIISQEKQSLKIIDREEDWARTIEEGNEGSYISSNNSFMRWDPSNITLSHPPRCYEFTAQPEDLRGRLSLAPLPSTLSFPPGSHKVLVYPQMAPVDSEFDPQKQVNFHSSQLSNSSLSPPIDSTTQPVRPFQYFSMTANLLPSPDSVGIEQNKEF